MAFLPKIATRSLVLILAAGCFISLRAQLYTATDLGFLNNGVSYVADMNNAGAMVGYTVNGFYPNYPGDYTDHGFLLKDGVLTDFGTNSHASGINNNGTVVGTTDYSSVGPTTSHPFSYSNGVMTDFTRAGGIYEAVAINDQGQIAGNVGTFGLSFRSAAIVPGAGSGSITWTGTLPGYQASWARDMNSSGTVVGTAYLLRSAPASSSYHAIRYSNLVLTDLGTLGGSESYANAINDSGTIVGEALTAGDSAMHAFSYSNGVMTDLGGLNGSTISEARAINNNGVIVGNSYVEMNGDRRPRAFIYRDALMTDLSSEVSLADGIYLQDATAINDRGQIAALGSDYHIYLITPIPEPSSYAVLVGCAALAGVMVRRRPLNRAA